MSVKKIAISGCSGFIGQALLGVLTKAGHSIHRIVRHPDDPDEKSIYWNPKDESFDETQLKGIDVLIHLAGKPVAEGRWSQATKDEILSSRVQGTRLLAAAFPKLEEPPSVFITASAIGFYGAQCGDQRLDEKGARGDDFLANVCTLWEEATQAAQTSATRVVNLRFGLVLAKHGGALKKMLLPFKMGVGGTIGSGEQWMSWITLRDAIRAIEYTLEHDMIAGPINVVSPNPVSNKVFTKALGKALKRPTLFPAPRFGMKALFGEMGEQTVLSNQQIVPQCLLDNGFEFKTPDIQTALFELLN